MKNMSDKFKNWKKIYKKALIKNNLMMQKQFSKQLLELKKIYQISLKHFCMNLTSSHMTKQNLM